MRHAAEANAVLKAADEWVAAQEVLVAARQDHKETEAEEEAVDIAGFSTGGGGNAMALSVRLANQVRICARLRRSREGWGQARADWRAPRLRPVSGYPL